MATKESYKYQSRYGSHKKMVKHDPLGQPGEYNVEKFGVVTATQVICEDEFGEYLTYRDRLDNHMADSCRFDLRLRGVQVSKEEKL